MQTEPEYLANECAKILAALPAYPTIERGNFKLTKGFAHKGIPDNFWYNPRTARISYFETPFDMEYPALQQFTGNKWMVWMSGSPLECLSMKSHAQKASRHMLIGARARLNFHFDIKHFPYAKSQRARTYEFIVYLYDRAYAPAR